MKTVVIPFQMHHARTVLDSVRGEEQNVVRLFGEDVETLLARHAVNGPAITLESEFGPVGCLGLSLLWTGVAECWAVTSDHLAAHRTLRVAFMRACVRQLDSVWEVHRLHRIQASVSCHDAVSIHWCERLHFAFEGKMPAYGPDGATYFRFARLRDTVRRLHYGRVRGHRRDGALGNIAS